MFPDFNNGIIQIIQFAAVQPVITKLLENENITYYIIISSPIIPSAMILLAS